MLVNLVRSIKIPNFGKAYFQFLFPPEGEHTKNGTS